jgi:hypothetical protein
VGNPSGEQQNPETGASSRPARGDREYTPVPTPLTSRWQRILNHLGKNYIALVALAISIAPYIADWVSADAKSVYGTVDGKVVVSARVDKEAGTLTICDQAKDGKSAALEYHLDEEETGEAIINTDGVGTCTIAPLNFGEVSSIEFRGCLYDEEQPLEEEVCSKPAVL